MAGAAQSSNGCQEDGSSVSSVYCFNDNVRKLVVSTPHTVNEIACSVFVDLVADVRRMPVTWWVATNNSNNDTGLLADLRACLQRVDLVRRREGQP